MPDIQLPKGAAMCSQCNENDYDDDYEDDDFEIDMSERWESFYNFIDQLAGYECSEFVSAPRGDSAEDDETESFFQNLITSFKADFENGIDTDGVLDLKRRLSIRDEARINTDSALNSMSAHEVMTVAVDLGLYQRSPLDETSARIVLGNVGVDFHDVLWNKALQYEQNDHETP